MRLTLIAISLLLCSACFGQSTQLSGQITKSDSRLEFIYLILKIKSGDSVIGGARPDSLGNFKIKNIPHGLYSLTIEQIGARTEVIESLLISKDTTINLVYPLPCKFLYSAGQKPKCIGGHTDHLIPIVYGYPSQKTIDKSKKGLLYLGGCIVSDCDPRFYCTIHKKEL